MGRRIAVEYSMSIPVRLFIKGAGSAELAGSDTADRRVEILILD